MLTMFARASPRYSPACAINFLPRVTLPNQLNQISRRGRLFSIRGWLPSRWPGPPDEIPDSRSTYILQGSESLLTSSRGSLPVRRATQKTSTADDACADPGADRKKHYIAAVLRGACQASPMTQALRSLSTSVGRLKCACNIAPRGMRFHPERFGAQTLPSE